MFAPGEVTPEQRALRLSELAHFSHELLCLFSSDHRLLCCNDGRSGLSEMAVHQSARDDSGESTMPKLLSTMLGEKEGAVCFAALQRSLLDSEDFRTVMTRQELAFEIYASQCIDPVSRENAVRLSVRTSTPGSCDHVWTDDIGAAPPSPFY